MKNIFLSRPSWVFPNYQQGLDGFNTLLRSHDLIPRTIGTTDYPSRSPMDEVIELLYECEGAIILGYPQIEITSGYLKTNAIDTPMNLPTEWNHIEGGLAYAIGLPLLVIHDLHISRGIFDRGVINIFLHKKDLSDKSWGISEDIVGAITKWKSHLKPVSKLAKRNTSKETPIIKFGCFTFPPDENLYCPFCYTSEDIKMLTIRDGIKKRLCTNCGKTIPSG